MQHTRLDQRRRPCRRDRLRQAFETVAHDDANVLDATILDLGQHLQPVFGALTTSPDPQPEDVAFTVNSDADRHVDRPVGDLPVTDLDVHCVYEDHRIQARSSGRFCHSTITSTI
jgi:hypothetical protein